MIDKKIFLFSIFLILLLSISVVSAEDSVDSIVADDISGDIDIDDDAIDSMSGSSILASSDDGDSKVESLDETIDENLDSASCGKLEEVCESDEADSAVVEDQTAIGNKPKSTLKSSSADYPTSTYITPVNTYYISGKYLYFGWEGYFNGYFKVFKGSTCVHSEYLYGYNKDLQWSTDNLGVGTFIARLIDDDYGALKSAKIIINKATSKIYVKSFTTRAGTRFHCYAYVNDRYDGANIDGGYVKFAINGRYYWAKLKDGVASFYFKVPSKVRRYVCKAYYLGGTNVKPSGTKFIMNVKRPIRYKVMSVKTRWDRYVYRRWGRYRVETYKFKTPTMSTLCIFLYKNGKMVNGYRYYSRFQYKYKGRWYWTKWRTSYGEATYHKTAGIDRGIALGRVYVKFRIS